MARHAEITVVEEFADGGAAVVGKVHHSMMDGMGGVQIAMLLFDVTEEPRYLGALPTGRGSTQPAIGARSVPLATRAAGHADAERDIIPARAVAPAGG
jgi:hypothetical protein